MSTPLNFKVTDAGLAEAASAAEQGIRLRITSYQVSSAFGYTVTGAETAMPGALLYSDTITSYQEQPDGHVIIRVQLHPQAGPFDFGSVGLISDSGTLVALAAFAQPQTKYTSLGSDVNSTFTFDCHLRLGQGIGIFDLSNADQESTFQFGRWKDLVPEDQMIDPRINVFFVNELDSKGEMSMLVKKPGGDTWSMQTNMYRLASAVSYSAINANQVTVPGAAWDAALGGQAPFGTFVVEFPGSKFRRVTVSASGSDVLLTYSDSLPDFPSAPGTFKLFTNESSLASASGAASNDLGMIAMFPFNTPEIGWIKCGGMYNPAAYPDLFAKLGTTFGGDGVNTFGTPVVAGEFPRFFDDGRGIDPGRVLGSFQDFMTGPHSHAATVTVESGGEHSHIQTQTPSGFIGAGANIVGGTNSGTAADAAQSTREAGAHSHTASATVGGLDTAENRPRNVALAAFIRYLPGVSSSEVPALPDPTSIVAGDASIVLTGTGTPADPYNLKASPQTLSLTGNALAISGGNSVALTALSLSLGVSQTWQDVKANRSLGTTFQNALTRPIAVSVRTSGTSGAPVFQVSTDGVSWVDLQVQDQGFMIVPPSHFYRVNASSGTPTAWAELR